MNRNAQRLTKRKRITLSVSAIAIVVAAGLLIFFATRPDESSAIALTEVITGDITETLEISGTVNSENQGTFEVLDGTLVRKINVRVGDQVKKGDILAEFDTSSVADVVSEKRQAYSQALDAYNSYISTSSDASEKLSKITNQVTVLEKEIEELSKKVEESKKQVEQNSDVTNLKDKFAEILGDNKMAADLIDRILASSSDFSKTIKLLQDIANGISTQISSITSLLSVSEEESQLISAQLELAQLKFQQGLLKLQSGTTLEALYLSVVESAKTELDNTLIAVEQLNKGWIAEKDGIVREINIVEGEYYTKPEASTPSIDDMDLTSLLSSLSEDSTDFSGIISQLFPGRPSGMVVEYYPLSATFTVSKNDIFKIALEQPVEITAASGEKFTGYISYINPVATDSSISINSLLSVGASSGGIDGKVIIENPNKNVIIGLDVDLSIELESAENTLLVPVESIQYGEDGAYVFIYDSGKKRVKKTAVKTGLFDGSYYQIVSGCKKGDTIVKAPAQDLEDGQKILAK